jgi:hypothetical protein
MTLRKHRREMQWLRFNTGVREAMASMEALTYLTGQMEMFNTVAVPYSLATASTLNQDPKSKHPGV